MSVDVLDICASLENIKVKNEKVFEILSNIIIGFEDIDSSDTAKKIASQDEVLCNIGGLFNEISSIE